MIKRRAFRLCERDSIFMDDVGRLWTGIGVCAAVILLMAFLTLCENAAVEFNDAKLKKMAEEDKDPKAIRLAALLGRTGRVVATNLIARSIMIIAVSVVGAIYFYAPLSNKLHKLLMYILRLRIILSAYVHLL